MNYKITDNLELVPIKNNYKWITYIAIAMVITLLSMYLVKPDTIRVIYKSVQPSTTNTPADIELSEGAIVKCLHENGCVLPNVAMAQARLESNVGKSNVGINAKNMFGITHHKCKYVSGKYGAYAQYETYTDNIKCYIHIQDNYLKNIDGRYAEDQTYITKIKNLK